MYCILKSTWGYEGCIVTVLRYKFPHTFALMHILSCRGKDNKLCVQRQLILRPVCTVTANLSVFSALEIKYFSEVKIYVH